MMVSIQCCVYIFVFHKVKDLLLFYIQFSIMGRKEFWNFLIKRCDGIVNNDDNNFYNNRHDDNHDDGKNKWHPVKNVFIHINNK